MDPLGSREAMVDWTRYGGGREREGR